MLSFLSNSNQIWELTDQKYSNKIRGASAKGFGFSRVRTEFGRIGACHRLWITVAEVGGEAVLEEGS